MKGLRISICGLAAFAVLAFGAVETWSESILEVGAAILFLWWAILIFARRETEVRWNVIFWPVLVFVGIACIQLALGSTAYPFLTRVALLKASGCFLLFFLSVQAFQTRRDLRSFAWFLMCFGFGIAVLGIAQNYTSHDELYWFRSLTEGGNPFGPYVDRDHFAGLMELIVPVGMSLMVFRGVRREQVLFIGVLTLVPAAALILTASRGGIASFVFEVGLLAAMTRLGRRRLRGIALTAILLGVLASVAWLGTGSVLSRVKSSSIGELSRDRRITMLESGWHIFLANPWMGAGLGTLVAVYPKYETYYDGRIVDHVHNDYIEVLAETGIAGGMCGLTFLVMLFREGIDRLKKEQSSFSQAVHTAGIVGCAGLLVHSLVDFNLHIPANGLFFLLLVAIVLSPVFHHRNPLTAPDAATRLPALTFGETLRHSFVGLYLSMASTVRKTLDCVQVGLAIGFFLLLGGVAAGQEKPQTPQQTNSRISQLAAAATSHASTGEIPIGAGDLLHVDVFEVPDLSRDVRVGETGLISLPLIPDRVAVAGCTPFELEGRLDKLLQQNGLVMHPQVSVIVKDQNSNPISIAGAVRHPVVFHEFRPTTLIEALSAADGIADDAGDSILITRPKTHAPACGEPDPPNDPAADPEMMRIKVSELLEKGDPAFNVPVYGGDVITVPRAGIIYVAGAVTVPGGYTLNDPGSTFNTMKIIALAHGLVGSAKANNAVILRKDSATGETKQIPVKLKKIMDRKSPDVQLSAGDILYVPDSRTRRVLGTATTAAIGIGTGLAIYRIP